MSRFQCPHCRGMHSTTGSPNAIEGYFVTDYQSSNVGRVQDLEDWLAQRARRAYHCPDCGVVTLEPEEAEQK